MHLLSAKITVGNTVFLHTVFGEDDLADAVVKKRLKIVRYEAVLNIFLSEEITDQNMEFWGQKEAKI
jgi:hypothetical protein